MVCIFYHLKAFSVTGHAGSSGSYEYLVYRSVLESIAEEHGFQSIIDYGDPKLEQLFDQVCSAYAKGKHH